MGRKAASAKVRLLLQRVVVLVAGLVCCLAAVPAHSQTSTTNSSLVVSMTVQSSISLVFVNVSGAGTQGTCSITNANTSAASVNFGIASIAGDNQPCVQFAANGKNSYSLTNSLYALVTMANVQSSNYTLMAALSSTPPTGVIWKFSSMTGNLSTTPGQVTGSGTYGQNLQMYLTITVPATTASGDLSQTLNFTATAN